MRHALFRADSSPAIGGGHVVRCLALADGLARQGWMCTFAGAASTPLTVPLHDHGWIELVGDAVDQAEGLRRAVPEGVALLVVDHYGLDAGFETACRGWARRILVIDDLADRVHDCDLLLDQTLGRQEAEYQPLVPEHCRLLLSSPHALLRPSFAALRPQCLRRRAASDGSVRRILVSAGTVDASDATSAILGAIKTTGLGARVDVVLGRAAPHLDAVKELVAGLGPSARLHIETPHMAALMAEADLAIGAAGSTSWERCCLGLPAILLVVADNQATIAEHLHKAGAVRLAGRFPGISVQQLASAIAGLKNDALLKMSEHAAVLCDGEGVARVLDVVNGS